MSILQPNLLSLSKYFTKLEKNLLSKEEKAFSQEQLAKLLGITTKTLRITSK